LDSSIPVEIEIEEDALLNEAKTKTDPNSIKEKRIFIAVAAVLFLLLATTSYFIATKGFDYVKDTIIGHPTKELLEGEWIRSTYGNPGVH
jgi:hypothetical protein